MSLKEIVSYTNELLRVSEIKDFPNAFNGLQMENPGTVTKIAAAVDACEAVVCEAVRIRADLLVVHHGMLWSGAQHFRGATYRKLKSAIEGGLAVYSAHLPLDCHPALGNNACMCRAMGFEPGDSFLDVGFRFRAGISRDELLASVRRAVGGPVHHAAGGPREAGNVGVVSGSAGSEVSKAAAEGIDTFVTGEGPHWSFTAAEELGVNLIYAGHYATETFGVKALAAHLAARFALEWEFIDHPTGL